MADSTKRTGGLRNTLALAGALLALLVASPLLAAAPKPWTLRAEANVGLLGVRMSSDSDQKVPVPLAFGQLVGSLNFEHISVEYGVGGPVLTQSLGARIRPWGIGRGHALYLGADYLAVFGGPNIAQFASGELGYEYIAAGGFTVVAGVGAFALITSFKDDETSGGGVRLRCGVGYSF